MKFKLSLAACACALTFLFAGCYTEFATHEPSDDKGYADDEGEYVTSDDTTDTGAASSDEYFSDDNYRHSRFSTSFGFYYPWRGGYYTTIYDPWFDDPWYWTDGWRPYVLYPYPTWYPYGPYYGHHYWGYYSDPWYYGGGGWYSGGGGSGLPHRTRLTGTTRGDDRIGIRSRSPLVTPSGSVASPGANPTGVRTRGGRTDEQRGGVSSPSAGTTRTRNGDTPWWERMNQDERRTRQVQQPQNGTEAQPERRRRQVEQAPSGGSAQPKQGTTPGTVNERPRRERRERSQSTERSSGGRQSQPRYSPPSNNGGGGGGRERSSGSAPSGRASSGGSSSSGGSRTRSGR